MKMIHPLTITVLALTTLATAVWGQSAAVLSETREGGVGLAMFEEISGSWLDSVGKSAAEGCTTGIGSRWVDITAGPTDALARWTLIPGLEDDYEAQVTWSSSGNATGVVHRITDSSGTTSVVTIDQDGFGYLGPRNNNQWITLGTFRGSPAQPIIIEISDEDITGQPDPASSGRIYADAARLLPTSEVAPPPLYVITPAPAPVTPPSPTPVVGEGIAWSNNFAEAESRAISAGRPLLLNFVSERSRDARRMEVDTWRDADVVAVVSAQCVAVRIEMELNRELCHHLAVYRSPTTLVLEPNTHETIHRLVGYAGAQELLRRLR